MPRIEISADDPDEQGHRLTVGAARILKGIRDEGPDATVRIDPESIDESHTDAEARHLRLLIAEGYLVPVTPGSRDYQATPEGLAALDTVEAEWREAMSKLQDSAPWKTVADQAAQYVNSAWTMPAFNIERILPYYSSHFDSIQRSLQPQINKLFAQLVDSGLLETTRRIQADLARATAGLDFSRYFFGWDCLLIDPDEFNVPEFLADTGIPLAGSTPPEVTQALMDADPGVLESVLLANQDAILTQCRHVLNASCGEYETSRHLANRAIGVFEAGQPEGAQALASCALEPLLAPIWAAAVAAELVPRPEGMSDGQYTEHTTRLLKYRAPGSLPPETTPSVAERYEATLGNFPLAVTTPVLLSALTHQDNVPPGGNYSRHATVHPSDPGHFTEANAMRAIMTVVSLLWAAILRPHLASLGDS